MGDARKLPAAQRAWRSYGASVFAVGIGNGINKKSLAVIAGSSARVLQTTFRTLGNIVKPLLNQVCKAIIHPCDKKNGGCQQLCIRRGSRAQCGCRNGFKLLANKKTCGKTCQKACTKEYKPVCASNGRTYSNQCIFEIAQCQAKEERDKTDKISQGKCKAPKHPCNINNGGCNQICRKIGKKAQCRCKSGFILGKDKKTCTQRSCASSVKLDLQLIVDTSGSVGLKNFNLMMKNIADKVLPKFNVGRGKTHVALHKYSTHQWTEFGLDRYFNLAAMQRRVKQTRHRGGWTYTAAAMTAALRTFKRKARRNRKVAKVCIVFTDGKATDARKLPAAQRAWRSYGASVFAVGIGNGINKKSLAVIAGSSARVLQTTFRTLGNIVKPLLNQVCKAIIHPCDKKNGGCQQLCIRRGSRAQCGCRNGFKLLANKKTCGKTCQKACTKVYKPVCASNGRTYSNQCVFEIAQCQAKKKGIKLTKISQGKCKAPKHPCNINNGGCNQICRKIGKKAQCRCKSGFILGKDKKTCTQRSCASSVKLDLQLIVDTSGSVGAKNFNLMMKHAKRPV